MIVRCALRLLSLLFIQLIAIDSAISQRLLQSASLPSGSESLGSEFSNPKHYSFGLGFRDEEFSCDPNQFPPTIPPSLPSIPPGTVDTLHLAPGFSGLVTLHFFNGLSFFLDSYLIEPLASSCAPGDLSCLTAVLQLIANSGASELHTITVPLSASETININSSTFSGEVWVTKAGAQGVEMIGSFAIDLDSGATLIVDQNQLVPGGPSGSFPQGFLSGADTQSTMGLSLNPAERKCVIYAAEGSGNQSARPLLSWIREKLPFILAQLNTIGYFTVSEIKVEPLSYGESGRIRASAEGFSQQVQYTSDFGDKLIVLGHSQGALTLIDGFQTVMSPLYNSRGIARIITIDPPLAGGWLESDSFWDVAGTIGQIITLGFLQVPAEIAYPASQDMLPWSEVMNAARASLVNREYRYHRIEQPEWDTFGPTDRRSYVPFQTAGANVTNSPDSMWDHDPWRALNRPENVAILARIEADLRNALIECGEFVPVIISEPTGPGRPTRPTDTIPPGGGGVNTHPTGPSTGSNGCRRLPATDPDDHSIMCGGDCPAGRQCGVSYSGGAECSCIVPCSATPVTHVCPVDGDCPSGTVCRVGEDSTCACHEPPPPPDDDGGEEDDESECARACSDQSECGLCASPYGFVHAPCTNGCCGGCPEYEEPPPLEDDEPGTSTGPVTGS